MGNDASAEEMLGGQGQRADASAHVGTAQDRTVSCWEGPEEALY